MALIHKLKGLREGSISLMKITIREILWSQLIG